jgi:hypothetical protein
VIPQQQSVVQQWCEVGSASACSGIDQPVAGPDAPGERWRWLAPPSPCQPRAEQAGAGVPGLWEDHSAPGWLEIDPMAHCGGRIKGRLLWTRMVTDIATGWRESPPIVRREA